jgi:hypothetical protein
MITSAVNAKDVRPRRTFFGHLGGAMVLASQVFFRDHQGPKRQQHRRTAQTGRERCRGGTSRWLTPSNPTRDSRSTLLSEHRDWPPRQAEQAKRRDKHATPQQTPPQACATSTPYDIWTGS